MEGLQLAYPSTPKKTEDSHTESVHFDVENLIIPGTSVPEGWFTLSGGFCLGQVQGTVVSKEGILYDPETVEVDLSVPNRPLWRFRTSKGVAVRKDKGLIPVRRTFLGLLDFLSEAPMLAKEWEGAPFTPSGAHASRAITVGLDDDTVTGNFMGKL